MLCRYSPWGRYSASTETILNQDLALIERRDAALDRLIGELRPPAASSNLLQASGKQRKSGCVLGAVGFPEFSGSGTEAGVAGLPIARSLRAIARDGFTCQDGYYISAQVDEGGRRD
jgi:hypothetical protein